MAQPGAKRRRQRCVRNGNLPQARLAAHSRTVVAETGSGYGLIWNLMPAPFGSRSGAKIIAHAQGTAIPLATQNGSHRARARSLARIVEVRTYVVETNVCDHVIS